MHRMIGKVYNSKRVWDIVKHSKDIKFVILGKTNREKYLWWSLLRFTEKIWPLIEKIISTEADEAGIDRNVLPKSIASESAPESEKMQEMHVLKLKPTRTLKHQNTPENKLTL